MNRGTHPVAPTWWLPTQAIVVLLWIVIVTLLGDARPLLLGLVLWSLLWFGLLLGTQRRLTGADWVTLVRLIAGSAALALWALSRIDKWSLVLVLVVGVLADAVDGYIARWRGATHFGAFLDAEVDAAFVLVLTVLAWTAGSVGRWILAGAALRYVFALAYAVSPLEPPVLTSFSWLAKAACALAAILLILACSPISSTAVPASVAALSALLLSFGREATAAVRSLRHRGAQHK